MRIRIRLFAMQRELAGTREVAVDLPNDADVAAAWAALVSLHPGLAPGASSIRFARNGAYADGATRLADGDEVAMIPPVSGGAPMDRFVELRETTFGHEILGELIDRLATPFDGAAVGFVGRTRRTPGTPAPGQEAEAARHHGRDVEALDYEAHELMALAVLDGIADEVATRFAVGGLAIVHRTGTVELGETSIAVVAVAAHRGDAFDAARYAIDETKARAPIWKAERFADGHVWIGHPARSGPEEDTP